MPGQSKLSNFCNFRAPPPTLPPEKSKYNAWMISLYMKTREKEDMYVAGEWANQPPFFSGKWMKFIDCLFRL